MRWKWSMCPNAHHGHYTTGNYHYPTIVLEAVASQALWIWNAFFASVSSLNDINILNNSPIFNKVCDNTTPDSSLIVRGTEYKFGYYLVDGIYPKVSVFVKILSCPDDPHRSRFKRIQEKARKYIERAFGALKKRWQIIAKASMFRDISTMTVVMYTCIILHNMILKHEGNTICVYDENEIIPETQPLEYGGQEWLQIMRIIHSVVTHTDLCHHLTDHFWTMNNFDLNMPPEDELEG
ncbi:unnamed protein product [Lactuca virosa]|uniref:DDE Tnp4 domain-containing protein n=1 Tax=Lactuca virosa TaxID=75947 RepID=A0AAU9N7I1_9ASTR|nr:unnamed protein product [Lactuca virosa]